MNFYGGQKGFDGRKERDRIKKDFALNNGFNFLEIPYWEKENIESIIEEKLKEIKSKAA